MKHKRSLLSIAMVTIMLCSLCALCASTSVSAAADNTQATASPLVGTPLPAGTGSGVCKLSDGGIALFVKGANNQLWWKRWVTATKTWTAWKSLGGILTSDPAALSQSTGVITVFVRGNDGYLWMKTSYDNGVTWAASFTPFGEQAKAGTGPCLNPRNSPGYYDVWWIAPNGNVWHRQYNAQVGWIDRENVGGGATSSPASGWYSANGNRLHVFIRGNDGNIWYRGSNTGWNWAKVNEQVKAGTGPGISSRGESVDLFWVGTDGQLNTKNLAAGWGTTIKLGGSCTSSPSTMNSGWIAVFVRGTDGNLWRHSSGAGWGNSIFGSNPIYPPP